MEKLKASISLGVSGISWSTWFTSKLCHETLSNLVLLVGLITGLAGLYWLLRIKRLETRLQEMKLCEQCRLGNQPGNCPIPVDERPVNCPKRLSE